MSRDRITLEPGSVTWVAMMAAGLLALSFVLGVQVGKQGAALKGPKAKSLDEELKELPETLTDQLRALEVADSETRLPEPPKPETSEAKPEPKAEAKELWTLQLVATKDPAEAKKVAEKAKAAGFPTTTLKEGGLNKVRLSKPSEKSALEKPAEKLKKVGLKTSPVRAD